MLKVAVWQLKNPTHAPNDWTNGAFYAGIFTSYQMTKSEDLLNALENLGKQTDWKPGRRFDHADDIAIAQTHLDRTKSRTASNLFNNKAGRERPDRKYDRCGVV